MPEEFEENTPTNTWRGNVKEEWCDYNGHLNLAYYVVIFDLATDGFYDAVGLGETYKNTTNHSWFTAESHVCYVSEVFSGMDVSGSVWSVSVFISGGYNKYNISFSSSFSSTRGSTATQALARSFCLSLLTIIFYLASRRTLRHITCGKLEFLFFPT